MQEQVIYNTKLYARIQW